jgi:hypothetical protein
MGGERSVDAMGDTKTDETRHGLTESEYAKLPPENRAALEWLCEYMATPLTDEEKAYWRELSRFVEDHPFTFDGKASA